ncbi:MAG: hypothetical protein JSS11_04645 [Verrucomicrobia bacterium]|nr:hypothetical protein [Verrucomicrobiota bacterium]
MKIRLNVLLASLFLTLLCGRAQAQVVNFNFAYDGYGSNYSGQGAYSDPGHNYWNRVGANTVDDYIYDPDTDDFTFVTNPGPYPQNRATMFASDGTTLTSIRITFNDDSFGTGDTPLFANDLYHTYYYAHTSPQAFTISGLTAGQAYDFYFYTESGDIPHDRSGSFTLDGQTLPFSALVLSAFSEGNNYVKFTLTPSGTTLNGSMVASLTSSGEANFAGLQIVAVTAVPEPATYAAIAGCVALAGGLIRRRSRQRSG